MATPAEPPLLPLPENPPRPSQPTQNQSTVVVKQEILATDPKKTSSPSTFRPPEPSSSISDVTIVPSYSRWFSWNNIHDCERRFLPEFFDGKSHSKNPKIYKYYRDSIIKRYRGNPSRKITFTEVRKTLVGDVGSIRRVFDFLEGWGLINYTASTGMKLQQTKWEEKESKSGGGLVSTGGDSGGSSFESSLKRVTTKKLCSGCQSLCSIACFACDKFDLTLCARCYVRGNYRVGLSAADFRRVEISEDTKTDWTDKDTLHLMEAILHYGDDWKKVSHHVGGKSEKECVSRFIKLSFGEEFVGPTGSGELDKYYQTKDQSDAETVAENNVFSSLTKRRRLTPLADASNPIVAQVAFLSAVVGSEVAEAAARGAVVALSEVDLTNTQEGHNVRISSNTDKARPEESGTTNGENIMTALQNAILEAQVLLDKEEKGVERSMSGIVEVQMKEIQDKIIHFEEVELQMEKEWQQLQHMKSLIFVDQQNLLHQRTIPESKIGGSIGEKFKTTDAVT
ncbi:SWI/SNF complex subunit SWI3B [Telopea speciosissima]|uniref:SWI/SNF complex subunit SWI3B n=1 Tax=Telopea speciosissima TaxID=54955 RepID=UPI001CC60AE4|nr:SWI/SNF complex subunit SWI3B [Telopea speciosissima]